MNNDSAHPAPLSPTPLDVLRENWGYDSFRGIQEEIITGIMAGHDTLGLMPTGGGKSITFQVPALCREGLCLVITPLIALMRDQVQNLRNRNILASAVYSGMSAADIERVYDNCIFGKTKFLYISPERLDSEMFQEKLKRMNVSLITVDEAHCISQWGYDFRPAYLRVKEVRKRCPGVPVLALTATATPEVVDDICRQLEFREGSQVFRMSFERKNLHYVVRQSEDKFGQLLHILQSVPGSAIVYTRSREGTVEMAHQLVESGVKALFFHAGLPLADKALRQQRWQTGETRVIVATNAFGMGIDKPDVRLVIHLDLPDSVEAYFQEAGRAGRDGQDAWAVLLYAKNDIKKMERHIAEEFPPKDFCAQIYEELAYYFQLPVGEGAGQDHEFNINNFCRCFRHYPVGVESALKLLTRAGYITYRDSDDNKSRVMFIMRRDELYYLRHLSSSHDRIISALMRRYTGLFAEYVFIEEETLSTDTGLSSQEIYDLLMDLTRQRIINYVPRKNVPHILYEQRRLETRYIQFPKSVYEERKGVFERHIKGITTYATEQDTCRSQYLLNYFGEKDSPRCGHCDVCCK